MARASGPWRASTWASRSSPLPWLSRVRPVEVLRQRVSGPYHRVGLQSLPMGTGSNRPFQCLSPQTLVCSPTYLRVFLARRRPELQPSRSPYGGIRCLCSRQAWGAHQRGHVPLRRQFGGRRWARPGPPAAFDFDSVAAACLLPHWTGGPDGIEVAAWSPLASWERRRNRCCGAAAAAAAGLVDRSWRRTRAHINAAGH